MNLIFLFSEEKVVFCKLTSLQLSIYRTLLESDDMKLVLRQKEQCDCGSQRTRARCCYKVRGTGWLVLGKAEGFHCYFLVRKDE